MMPLHEVASTIPLKKTLHALLLVPVLCAFASAQGPWTPPGGTNGRHKTPVKSKTDFTQGELTDLTTLIRKFDPDTADEIEASYNSTPKKVTIQYVKTLKGKSFNGLSVSRGSNTILIRKAGSTERRAGTLYHEWQHIRNGHGYIGDGLTVDDFPPGTFEDPRTVSGECQHYRIYEKQLELLCKLAECDLDPNDTTPNLSWTPQNCREFEALVAKAAKDWHLWLQQIEPGSPYSPYSPPCRPAQCP